MQKILKLKRSFSIQSGNSISLLLILVVASILRLYHLDSFPFTHDEFSAITRTHFNSFSELIRHGVLGDGHPAGIQVFLFYWIKLFGINEFWIKIPFAVLGIFSIIITYQIAKKWFNSTVGLISASFIATLQYFVMYSQIARPYISGLFFCLLAVYYWSNYIFYSDKKFDKNIVFFIIGAILSSYNHYFSLLFIIIIGITGSFFIKKERLLFYIFSGVCIFLFFIPHLKITFHIIEMKGLTWLGKPGIFFFTDYLKFLFHYSYILLLLIVCLLVLSYFFRNKDRNINKFRLISFIFFISPLIIGFTYSIMVKPILQFSMLIFSTPFLIMLLTSYLKEFCSKINLSIIVAILSISSISLIFERDHYKIFYKSGFQEVFKENAKAIKQYKNILSLISTKSNSAKYYLNTELGYSKELREALIEKNNIIQDQFFHIGWNSVDSIIRFNEKTNMEDYKTFLNNQDSDYLFYGWAHNFNRRIFDLIPKYYPYLIEKKYYFHSETYVFSKQKPSSYKNEPILYSSSQDFEDDKPNWSKVKNITDTISFSEKHSCHISNDELYSTTFHEKFNKVSDNKMETISCSVKFCTPNQQCNAYLVFKIEGKNKTIRWYYADLGNFIDENKKWQTAYLNVQIEKIHLPSSKKVSVFIWNHKKEDFFIDDFKIEVTEGNKNRFRY